jgi:hypothetical protein
MPLYKLNLFCNIVFSYYNCGIMACCSYKFYALLLYNLPETNLFDIVYLLAGDDF